MQWIAAIEMINNLLKNMLLSELVQKDRTHRSVVK